MPLGGLSVTDMRGKFVWAFKKKQCLDDYCFESGKFLCSRSSEIRVCRKID